MREVPAMTFVGSGNAGSWQIRGRQIAAALGVPSLDYRGGLGEIRSPVAVIVKRVPATVFSGLRERKVRTVWDMVDFWAQPDTFTTLGALSAMLQESIACRRPDEVIVSCEAMREDVNRVAPEVPCSVIPHHCDPRITLRPAPRIEGPLVVGYVGRLAYVHDWVPSIRDFCAAGGNTFEASETPLPHADVLIGPRVGVWDTLASRRWKSNVKQANAFAQGVPFVATPHAAYSELEHEPLTTWTSDSTLQGFLATLELAMSHNARFHVWRQSLLHPPSYYSLRAIADTYASRFGARS